MTMARNSAEHELQVCILSFQDEDYPEFFFESTSVPNRIESTLVPKRIDPGPRRHLYSLIVSA